MQRRSAAAGLLLALAACGGGGPKAGGVADPGDREPSARPRSTASLSILAPADGATIDGPTVTVRVEVTGATVLTSGSASREVRPDRGHLHIKLDGKTLTLLAGTEYEIADVAPGRHVIEAEFAAGDHLPFNPRVVAFVVVTVR